MHAGIALVNSENLWKNYSVVMKFQRTWSSCRFLKLVLRCLERELDHLMMMFTALLLLGALGNWNQSPWTLMLLKFLQSQNPPIRRLLRRIILQLESGGHWIRIQWIQDRFLTLGAVTYKGNPRSQVSKTLKQRRLW